MDNLDPNAFFNQLFNGNGEHVEALRAQRQLAFEERVIKRVFADCGVKIPSWGKMVNVCRESTGQPKLNFNWFNSEFRFPVHLCGKRFRLRGKKSPKLFQLTLSDIFKPLKDNRLFNALAKNLIDQEVNTERGFVFVFPVVRTMFCAHNVFNTAAGPRWTIPTARGILTVERAQSFFNSVGSDWYFA